MSDKKELICIGCPKGCRISVSIENNVICQIHGYSCRRGEEYARNEITNPVRIVTTTVPVDGGEQPVLPVKTQKDIPKSMIFDCIRQIKMIRAAAPVKIGDVILKNFNGTGIDIVAAKSIAAGKKEKAN